MKKPKLEDYELFYLTIPQHGDDYYLTELADADAAQIQTPSINLNQQPTLSDTGVKLLARDQLSDLNEVQSFDSTESKLFTDTKRALKTNHRLV